MRKAALVLLTTFALTACSSSAPMDNQISENAVIGGQVAVNFLSQAEEWNVEEVVTENKEFYLQHEPDYIKEDSSKTPEDYLKSLYTLEEGATETKLRFWKVGTIQNGDYVGQSLVLVSAQCDGPCPSSIFRYAVDETTKHWTGLIPYSNSNMGTDSLQGPGSDLEASIEIPALNIPYALNAYENDVVQAPSDNWVQNPHYFGTEENSFDSAYEEVKLPNDNSFQKYYKSAGTTCLFGETPDGILIRYQVLPAIFGFTSDGEPNTQAEFDLQMVDGETLQTETHTYALTAGGCGFLGACAVTHQAGATEGTRLVELGTLTRPYEGSNVGQTVYTLQSIVEGTENELSAAIQSAYDGYTMTIQYKNPPETAMSMEDFLDKNMVVLIKMDDGRYTLAYDSTVAPVAECGKPVIYLYPTTPQEVSVKVNKVNFTKTVPAYGDGWIVWAKPSGLLTNVLDGKTYPYLFWEGQSAAKLGLSDSWTLAQKDVSTELPKALKGMGLNNTETADFLEFWLPKLQAVKAPYIQFSFEGTAAMNEVAPLEIIPTPDSMLRIFMFYQGVSKAGQSMPTYSAPARHGFSVVEWGGSLY